MVLIVEDHDALREATLQMVRSAGFTAGAVSCAEEVDQVVLSSAPNVYVIDLNLPGQDGLELASRLRTAYPTAGIVMTTARSGIDDRVAGYAGGADVYLPKPVEPEELLAVLRSLATRISIHRGGVGLILQGCDRMLRGPAAQARLSEAEVRLLSALASAPDNTIERWQVAMQLAPHTPSISADALQNRLSVLRRKIASCGIEGESLLAIRGRGYRLCVPLQIM